MTHRITLALYLITFSLFFNHSNALEISGNITNIGAENLTLHINGKEFKAKHNYLLDVDNNEYYEISFSAPGYYPSFQTFSHFELTSLSNNGSIKLPDIQLVKKQDNRVMFAFGGDVMMGRRFAKPKFNENVLINSDSKLEDTKLIVQKMKPYLEIADFSAVNLETQISDVTPKERAPKGVTFYSPPETVQALKWAGIDYVTLGNNHTYDYLDKGLESTIKFLNQYQMPFSGAGHNQEQALKPYQADINNVPYSMLGFVGWEGGFSPTQTASLKKGGSAFGSKENIIKTVVQESNLNRATVVQYHGSLEYTNEPSGMTESRLKSAVDHGADLVIAHHPHVTQGFEVYKGKLIAYSMGNFIFDQYFHSTPLSYVLYVWMDGDSLHRAELVPVYLKGYMPTAATGTQRNTITNRVKLLSGKRDLTTQYSGGHLVLTHAQENLSTDLKNLHFLKNERLHSLFNFPMNGEITNITQSKPSFDENRYRLGQNLLNGGDFETYTSFNSDERSWELHNAKISKQAAYSGNYSLNLNLDERSSKVGMKTFRRVFKAANPMSYQAKINTDIDVSAKLYFQKRKTRDKLSEGFKNEPVLLAATQLKKSDNWQSIEFDFNTPRVGYRSYRIWLELEAINPKQDSKVYFDDAVLIEWQPHYTDFGKLPRDKSLLNTATHIGLEKKSSKDFIEVSLEFKK